MGQYDIDLIHLPDFLFEKVLAPDPKHDNA